jgi:hypothetical protein
MNPDQLREQLHRASLPPRHLTAPLADLHRRGRARRRRRYAITAAAACLLLVISGAPAAVHRLTPEPPAARASVSVFPKTVGDLQLIHEERGAVGQNEVTPAVAADGRVLYYSVTCTSKNPDKVGVRIVSETYLPELPCSPDPSDPNNDAPSITIRDVTVMPAGVDPTDDTLATDSTVQLIVAVYAYPE